MEGDHAQRQEAQEVSRDRLDQIQRNHQRHQWYHITNIDCYIISTIQALFVTEALPALVDSLKGGQRKGKTPLLDELRRSF